MSFNPEEILKRPDAVIIFEKMKEVLDDESRRRQEFRDWLTEDVQADFINGEIFVHSPAKRGHLLATSLLSRLLTVFVDSRKLGATAIEKALVAMTRNDYEPDICFWGKEKSASFTNDTMLHPPPDFVVEVLSKKTRKNDRVTKYTDYAIHGVREYWIIDPVRQTVEQFGLLTEKDTVYVPYGKVSIFDDITSLVLPEFTIPVNAIFDEEANLKALKNLMG